MTNFVEVLVTATGETAQVPADWLDHPILGRGLEKSVAQRVFDGEVEPEVVAEPPTENSLVAEIDDFAEAAGIDLSDAKTKKEKVAVINEALAASAPTPQPEASAPVNPDVQLVHGDVSNASTIPAVNMSTTHPDGSTSSDETPVAGDEEN